MRFPDSASAPEAPLIAGPAQPGVELLLDRPLDDQPSAQQGKLAQHLLRIIDAALRQQLVDARLYLRRRLSYVKRFSVIAGSGS